MTDAIRINPALEPLAVRIDSLTPDPHNARLHGDRNLRAIRASLERFGQRKPIVVRKEGRTVVAGNGLLAAAKSLGWTEVAALILDDDELTAKAYAVADNRTAELSEWDVDVLRDLVRTEDLPLGELWTAEELGDLGVDVPIPPAPDLRAPPSPIISYMLVFDNEEQQREFYDWLKRLRERFPEAGTMAARIILGIRDATR